MRRGLYLPCRRVDNLARKERSIVEEVVERLCLSYKSTCARPIKILCLELAKQLFRFERR